MKPFFFSTPPHPVLQLQPLFESLTQFSGTHCLQVFLNCDDVALLKRCYFYLDTSIHSNRRTVVSFSQVPVIATLLNLYL